MFGRWKFQIWLIAIAAVLGALVAAFLDEPVAYTQGADHDYVDVAVILDVPDDVQASLVHDLNIIVVNNGSRPAYDVEVVVDVVDPDNSRFNSVPEVPVGSASLERIPGGMIDDARLRWTIPELGGLQREEVAAKVRHESTVEPVFDNSLYPHELFGEVTTSSFEGNLHQGNNTDRVWSYNYLPTADAVREVLGNYSVDVVVDDPSPSPGGTVNFTITAGRANPYTGSGGTAQTPPPIDLKVDVELTDGLTVTGTPTYAPATDRADTVSYSNGVFTIGTLQKGKERTNSVTLPITVASSALVNGQCLTATLTGDPPPGTGPFDDDISDNVAKVCLGQPDGPVVFASGQSDLLTLFPCVGETAYPCNATDSVELAATGGTAAVETAPNAVFQPENITIRVLEPDGRRLSGNDIVWRTGHDTTDPASATNAGNVPGVSTRLVRPATGYNQYTLTIADATPGDESNPGDVKVALAANLGLVILDTSADSTSFGPNDFQGPYQIIFEFTDLGTYIFDITASAEHGTPATEYEDTAAYTFHVGPIAELEVRDGGASPDLATDQYALRVAALSNGPDDPPDAEVTIDLSSLPSGVTVANVITSDGTYSAGKWDLGALKSADNRISQGKPEEANLTLILAGGDAASATATATIANVTDYSVCIGSDASDLAHTTQTACEADTANGGSWHTGPVYDYNDSNNTATITAHAGTGGGGEGAPTLRAPSVHMPAVGISWSEVEFLHGVPVKDYQVQWSTDGVGGWTQIDTGLTLPELFDITIQSGQTRYYRVRAVNEADVPGPWSTPIAAMAERQPTAGAPDRPVITAAPKEPNRRAEILMSWTKPLENGSTITSYTLEVSDTGRTGSWSDSGAALDGDATSWTHSGLTGGTTKYYRLLATNMCDTDNPNVECDSLWSDAVSATTDPPGQAGPPTNVQAAPDGDSAIDVSWSAPQDDGGTPITRYEVQWSADGLGGWNNAGSTADGATLTFKNTGMTFGTTRHYRVAARNSRGLSAWSDPPYASATTLAGVPGQPSLTARAADANTIALTWTVPADNGDPITRYEIEWSEDGSANSWSRLTITGASDTSHDHSGLDPGTQRYYRIRAVNDTGDGSWSVVRNATTPPAPPGAPTLRASANGENAIDLAWDPPTNDGGAAISQYELQVSTDGGTTYSRLTGPSASARSYTHSGLQPGDGRHYQLRARNSAGWGPFSQPVFASTLTGVPAAPSLTARANGATEIKLTWTKPNHRGSNIISYRLDVSDDGNAWNSLAFSISAGDSEYVHAGLAGGTTKYYRIRAVNANGDGQWSAARSARTDAGGPDAPALTATPVSDNQIDLSWTVPADNGSSIRGYWVERSVDGNAPWSRLSSGNSATTYSDTDLYRGMRRYYRVAATNGAGTGPFSNVASATTTGDPATSPEAPTLVRLSNVARGQVTLAWDPPEDDGGAPVSGYEYQYRVRVPCGTDSNSRCFSDSDLMTTTGTSARITGLTDAGLYIFSVRAVNPIGKGDSASIQGTLAPSSDSGVRVSPASFTVDEGEAFSYTVRLATEPPHPVVLFTRARSGDGNLSGGITAHFLIPDNYRTHPKWNASSSEWDQGATITRTAEEDGDAVDGNTLIDIWVERVGYDYYKPCEGQTNETQCRQDWEDDWAGSPYRKLSGPSFTVIIRDDD